MKLTAPVKAFILSFLITGNLALLLWGYQIKNNMPEVEETEYDIELAAELPEEELLESTANPQQTETHKAFNETRKELTALNNQSKTDEDDFQQRLKALDDAIKNVEDAKDNPSIEKADPYQANKKLAIADGNNSKTSIRYRLVDRNTVYVPNPVYTCAGSGTVVVNITVDGKGRVIEQQINQKSSNTTNGCLWDAALDYASQTVFSEAKRASQLGTITYYFPGQG